MRIFLSIIGILGILYLAMWFASRRTYPIEFGISFNQNQATALGLDWRNVYRAMLTELRPPYLRIAAMWSEVEREKGILQFADVDWMMEEAARQGTKVVLVIGQKAPRWPECHVPDWFAYHGDGAELMSYLTATVERYKHHPALELWQVENEPFITFRFGNCEKYREDLVDAEIALVKQLDPAHQVMITDSGELSTWRRAVRAGDIFGSTLYRVVRTPKGYIFTYDWLPAAFYRWKARLQGRDLETFFIAELQAEPWFTDAGVLDTPIEIQEKTMNIERLQRHIAYASRIGVPRAYLWGVEWWYWMRETQQDDRYWEEVKVTINQQK